MQVTSTVLLLQNGSIIRNSASLLRFSGEAVKHPLSKELAKALSKRAGFPLCLCCEPGRGIHQPLLILEEGMAGVRRIDLNPPLAKLTIEGSIHIKMKH